MIAGSVRDQIRAWCGVKRDKRASLFPLVTFWAFVNKEIGELLTESNVDRLKGY